MGEYLVEGKKFVTDAFCTKQKIQQVIIDEHCHDLWRFESEIPSVIMKTSLFQKLAQTETSQGILAVVKKPADDIGTQKLRQGSNVIVLDRLQDPGNIGTIIRTADAAGYEAVVALCGTGDIYAPKVVRATAGSIFRMPVIECNTPEEAAEFLKQQGKAIISTCLNAEHHYFDIDMKQNIALIIGNEGSGISEALIRLSDFKIKIPMNGTIDSLNASVAAGILMYESVRK